MQVEGIDFFVFEVSDIDRAIMFYRDVLGLNHIGTSEKRGWAEFQIGEDILALRGQASALLYRAKFGSEKGYILEDGTWSRSTKPRHAGASVALRVADVLEAITELRSKGVSIVQEPFDSDVCHVAVIEDPDGNAIFLHRRHD